ncbi:methyltransferase [Sphingosinicella rhizophila]|uniref:Methyltransferase n=1 Tax=Sphingosinicella rhizophila TaxID=3050082 RepID=A0ABU3Q2B2_9SPHN|nr:methyltransferase [Sphingosinicella sp. GR2756]MDT9597447.1 methyltransferase [Sphingosinicella sp. GR2756]
MPTPIHASLPDSDAVRADAILAELLSFLEDRHYRFVTPTPATHRRVLERPGKDLARDLRDALGWSRPFEKDLLPQRLLELLMEYGWCGSWKGALKFGIRVSTISDRLFVHSAFPTDDPNSVFLGPDSYRFADFVRRELIQHPGGSRLVDIGAGAGVGAITAAPLLPGARLALTDINPLALRFARVNAFHAGIEVETFEGSCLEGISGPIDLAIANPPFIVDDGKRAYRDGGSMHGAELSLMWAKAAMARLEPGGRMLLYTGSAIVNGRDALEDGLKAEAGRIGAKLRYREIDPDIFGEELDRPAYATVDRIAAVGAVIRC